MTTNDPLVAAVRQEPFPVFARLLPGVPVDDVCEVRRAFCAWLNVTRLRFATWRHGWDAFIGRRCVVRYTSVRCRDCRGRRYPAGARMGGVACARCAGTGRGEFLSYPAVRATASEQD